MVTVLSWDLQSWVVSKTIMLLSCSFSPPHVMGIDIYSWDPITLIPAISQSVCGAIRYYYRNIECGFVSGYILLFNFNAPRQAERLGSPHSQMKLCSYAFRIFNRLFAFQELGRDMFYASGMLARRPYETSGMGIVWWSTGSNIIRFRWSNEIVHMGQYLRMALCC